MVVMESYILQQEVMLGREPNNGWGGSTVVWGLGHGSSPHGAKRLEPQMSTRQGVLRRQREMKSVLPADDRRASSLSSSPAPPRPTNLYYFLLLAVSSNKLRLITGPPA